MADTATSLADVLKEAWTSNRMQKQFEDRAEPFKRIQKVEATMIGEQAQVPILKHNAGGFTSFGAAGGSFNTYNNVGVDQATYTLVNQGMPISLEFSALNQAGGNNAQAVIGAKDLAIEAAISEIGKQGVRQLVTNGDGIVAQCDTGGASNTVELIASPSGTAYGFDAIQSGMAAHERDRGHRADQRHGRDRDGRDDLGLQGAVDRPGHHDRLVGIDGVGNGFRVHREPELGDGSEPGDERAAQHRQHHRCARWAEPRHRRGGVLGRGRAGHHDHGVLARPGAEPSACGAAEVRQDVHRRVDVLQAAAELLLAAAEPGPFRR